ncbi:MAG: hypothetical protein RLZZ393_1135 [Pseudomonadota bacterium]|jgi:DNA-binding NarL/FixJ family response regulator
MNRSDQTSKLRTLAPTGRSRVLLVDGHAIVREGLKAIIELTPDLEVIDEAGTQADAVRLAKHHNPDVILTELALAGSAGTQGIAELRLQAPGSKILVLSVMGNAEFIRAALEAGANGYVLKDSSRTDLLNAIRGVIKGERRLCPKSSEKILSLMLKSGAPAPASAEKPASQMSTVTGRERSIISMIATGKSTKAIANNMNLSVKTIEKHRYNAMRKLGLRNVAQVTRFAIDSGMVREKTGTTGVYRVIEGATGTFRKPDASEA